MWKLDGNNVKIRFSVGAQINFGTYDFAYKTQKIYAYHIYSRAILQSITHTENSETGEQWFK